MERSVLDALISADDGTERIYVLTGSDGTSALRMFADPRDVAAALMRMMVSPEAIGEVFNVGPVAPHSDRELARHLCERLGLDTVEIRHPAAPPSWYLNIAKARSMLGYRPMHSAFGMVDEAVSSAPSSAGDPVTDATRDH